jgi:succinate dehydrogenase/fumarate reductase-like Fe-S protein
LIRCISAPRTNTIDKRLTFRRECKSSYCGHLPV